MLYFLESECHISVWKILFIGYNVLANKRLKSSPKVPRSMDVDNVRVLYCHWWWHPIFLCRTQAICMIISDVSVIFYPFAHVFEIQVLLYFWITCFRLIYPFFWCHAFTIHIVPYVLAIFIQYKNRLPRLIPTINKSHNKENFQEILNLPIIII